MNRYRIQFKLVRLTDIANPLSWFYGLRDQLEEQLFIDYPIKDQEEGEWQLTKLMTVKKRTEIWADVILDIDCWVSLRLRGRGNGPSPEALEKGMEWANTVAEAIEKVPGERIAIIPNAWEKGSTYGRRKKF